MRKDIISIEFKAENEESLCSFIEFIQHRKPNIKILQQIKRFEDFPTREYEEKSVASEIEPLTGIIRFKPGILFQVRNLGTEDLIESLQEYMRDTEYPPIELVSLTVLVEFKTQEDLVFGKSQGYDKWEKKKIQINQFLNLKVLSEGEHCMYLHTEECIYWNNRIEFQFQNNSEAQNPLFELILDNNFLNRVWEFICQFLFSNPDILYEDEILEKTWKN